MASGYDIRLRKCRTIPIFHWTVLSHSYTIWVFWIYTDSQIMVTCTPWPNRTLWCIHRWQKSHWFATRLSYYSVLTSVWELEYRDCWMNREFKVQWSCHHQKKGNEEILQQWVFVMCVFFSSKEWALCRQSKHSNTRTQLVEFQHTRSLGLCELQWNKKEEHSLQPAKVLL
jgi:hypothetical protein